MHNQYMPIQHGGSHAPAYPPQFQAREGGVPMIPNYNPVPIRNPRNNTINSLEEENLYMKTPIGKAMKNTLS